MAVFNCFFKHLYRFWIILLDIVRKNKKTKLDIVAKMSCGFAGFNGVGIFRKMKEGYGK